MRPKLRHHIGSFILPVTVTGILPFVLLNVFGRGDIDGVYGAVTLVLGLLSIGVGLTLLIATVYLFHAIGRGTLAPWHATKGLVTEGPYRYTRNPMISGVLFILIGEAIVFQSFAIFVWALLFYIGNTIFFIKVEEPYLQRKHGKKYERYKAVTNRWLPLKARVK